MTPSSPTIQSFIWPTLVVVAMAAFGVGLMNNAESAPSAESIKTLHGQGYTDPIPSVGPVDSPVMIVEVADYNCVWCGMGLTGRAHGKAPFVKRLLAEHDEVLFVFKHFLVFRRSPVTRQSTEAGAVAALAAQRQGRFWAYHDHLFQHTGDVWNEKTLVQYATLLGLDTQQFIADCQDPALLQHVRLDDAASQAVGVPGTPAMYINGLKVPNVADPADIRRLIQEARQEVLSLVETGKATSVVAARRLSTVQRAGETYARHFHDHDVVGLTVDDTSELPPTLNPTIGGN